MANKQSGLSLEQQLKQRIGTEVDLERRRVEYGPRAFNQDAGQAIKNDPNLALIEAITNCDDTLGNREGSIDIYVSGPMSKPWTIDILDDADGIPHDKVEEKLIKLGGRTSGLESGKSVRGNRGRGARDLASLGSVLFQTIHNNIYSSLLLDRGGDLVHSKQPIKATPQLRAQTGIKRNGTRVTITCTSATKPMEQTMARRLQQLVGLRDIMQNPNRHITLHYGDNKPINLRYTPPSDRVRVGTWKLPVTGYRGKVQLTLYESAKPFDEDPGDIAREGGILIKGGRAIHQSTLFEFENMAAAKRLSGELRWDALDDLIRDFDDREEKNSQHPADNPFAIVRRSRDGLDAAHPAFKALRTAVRPIIAKEIKRLEQEMSSGTVQQTEQTKRRFSQLADLFGKFWQSKQQELEDDDTEGTGFTSQPSPGLSITPPNKRIGPGENTILSVKLVTAAEQNDEPSVALNLVEAEPKSVVKLSCATLQLKEQPCPDPTLHQYAATFRITAGKSTGEALIEARCGDLTGDLYVTVKPKTELSPDTLRFDHEHYRLRPRKSKKIQILAPAWLVRASGANVEVRSSSPSDIRVKKAALQLKPHEGWYVGETAIDGDRLEAKAKITAHLGKVIAIARAVVTENENKPKVEVKIDHIEGKQRAQVKKSESGNITVTINGTHAAAKRYLGTHPEYLLQNTVPACVLLAEVAGEEMVQFFFREKYKTRQVDAVGLEAQRVRELDELMPKIHHIMLPDKDLNAYDTASSASTASSHLLAEPAQTLLPLRKKRRA